MSLESYPWQTKQLPRHYDDRAVDNSEIRLLFRTDAASVVHCTLPPKATSVAARNIETNEIWYFITGQGEFWRRQEGVGREETIRVGPGTAVTVPADVGFQFRSIGEEPLTFLCITMPPWRPGVTIEIEGPWQPSPV